MLDSTTLGYVRAAVSALVEMSEATGLEIGANGSNPTLVNGEGGIVATLDYDDEGVLSVAKVGE